jgi:hypothetical protein
MKGHTRLVRDPEGYYWRVIDQVRRNVLGSLNRIGDSEMPFVFSKFRCDEC